MRLALPFAFVTLLAAATPALAVPVCSGGDGAVSFSFGFSVGGPFSEAETNAMELNMLQSMGIKATRTERWSGCIRAWVTQPDGREVMEFYDPETFKRVE